MSTDFSFDRPDITEGPPCDFLLRYRDLAARVTRKCPSKREAFDKELLTYIAHTANLRAAWDALARKAGPGAGPDGRNFADYTRAESWETIKWLNRSMRTGKYRHGPLRKCRIPKRPGSQEKRTIWIANVADRVVARATLQILQPILEPIFHQQTICRANQGRQYALAYAHWFVERQERTVCIVEDLKNAFDAVPRPQLLETLQGFIPNDRVTELVERLLGAESRKGIPQGSPISTMLMNFYADYSIVAPWHKLHPTVPLLRYVDDMLIMCSHTDNPEQLYADLNRFAQAAGFKLKAGRDESIRDLSLASISWLGYHVSVRNEQMRVRSAWTDGGEKWAALFADKFLRVHAHPDAALRAPLIMEAIIHQSGPSFEFTDTRAAYKLLAAAAKAAAFEEIPTYQSLLERWSWSRNCWLALKDKCYEKMDTKYGIRPKPWGEQWKSDVPFVPGEFHS